MSYTAESIRNIAIIAHVDHGKTTLVDHLLKQSGTFRENEAVEDRMMDSMDLERERGITIAAKNASFIYKDIKVNIVDTPGHSDFGGEVERILDMVDGAILLVDASEGPLPQTRFVLKKALEKNLELIVCVNKIDRPDSRIEEVVDEVFSLFIDLDASEEQADFSPVYAIARDGKATMDYNNPGEDLRPLFDMIIDKIPAPKTAGDNLQLLISNIDYSDYVGRLGVGRVRGGSLKVGQEVAVCAEEGQRKGKVTALYSYKSSGQQPTEEINAGDIAVVAGLGELKIGDTITSLENPAPLPRITVEEPTVGIMVSVNDGPFAGKEGKHVTSRKIKERLDRELRYNVALRVQDTDSPDTWKVLGRGELQLAVFLEQIRREGFEVLVSKPQVLFKDGPEGKLEPIEHVVIDVEEAYQGAVTKKLGERKGILNNITSMASGRTRLEFQIPTRGLIGYRSEFLTDTRGTGLLNTQLIGFEDYRGDIIQRKNGALVSDRAGKATAYSLANLEDRGRHFITPGAEVYLGMVIGENSKENNLNVNVVREKKLTNVRASGKDDSIQLTPVKPMSLEEAMEWISDEELIEVTPENIRLRCRILDPHKRKK